MQGFVKTALAALYKVEIVISCTGIVTLALVSHFWPLPEPAKSLEMLQRHEAKQSEFGGEPCQRDNAASTVLDEILGPAREGLAPVVRYPGRLRDCHQRAGMRAFD
ncbi:MAG: hypothetical protein EXR02_09535 [Rhodospirillales bacterium]|nr:hypothetical protein [Rhodospirillales bacterium]